MYTINQTDTFEKRSIKFFKKHRDLVPKFKERPLNSPNRDSLLYSVNLIVNRYNRQLIFDVCPYKKFWNSI